MTLSEYQKLSRVRRTLENIAPMFPKGKPTSFWLALELFDLVMENADQAFMVQDVTQIEEKQ